MNNKLTRFFQGMTLNTFTMGVFNSINGVKAKKNMSNHEQTINNLNNKSKDIYRIIKENINIINENLDNNQGNTITNFSNKVDINNELLLFINANYNNFKDFH